MLSAWGEGQLQAAIGVQTTMETFFSSEPPWVELWNRPACLTICGGVRDGEKERAKGERESKREREEGEERVRRDGLKE